MTSAAVEDAARFWRAAAALARTPDAACLIGETPKTVVARREGVTLWRYRPTAAPDARAAPLILAHGLVGRPSVCDIDPDRSMVRRLLDRGVAVHLLDWGPSRPERRWLRFEDFALDHLGAAAAAVTAAEGRRPVAMGVCEGGLFALCLAALAPRTLAGLALAVTPFDLHAPPVGGLARMVRAVPRDALEGLIDALGGMPGPTLGAIFQGLTPSRTLRKHSLGLVEAGGDPDLTVAFLRMERWLADRPDHPAEAARQLLVELYHDNRLARGRFRLDGAVVDPGAIAVPVLSILGLRDHIAPPPSVRALAPRLRAPHREVAIDAGHIGVFVSRRAQGLVAAALDAFVRDQAVLAASRV